MTQGFKSLSAGSNGSLIALPYAFLAMNLLTQVVCVSGVNKLTSVRGKHVSDRPDRLLISNTLPGNFFCFHQRSPHGTKGYQPVPEYMVLWERLELFSPLRSWDGVCRVVGVLDYRSLSGKEEGIDPPRYRWHVVVFCTVRRDCQSHSVKGGR